MKIIAKTILLSAALCYMPAKANPTHTEKTIGSYIAEHKLAIGMMATLALGITLNHYFFKEDTGSKVSLIPLNISDQDPSTVFLFAHGIDPRSSVATIQAARYVQSGAISNTCYTFSFNDRLSILNFGQARDCRMLVDAYTQVREKHPHASIVLVGISRGASAILNTIAMHRDVDWSSVKAIILESPYDHVESLIGHIMNSYAPYIPYGKNILYNLVKKVTQYRHNGLQTIDMSKHLPKHIPIFVSYSKTDKTVSPECTRTLIARLESNEYPITSYAAESGRHSTLAEQPDYTVAVQQFLQEHMLN